LANGSVELIEFTCLGSVVSTTGGTEEDVEAKLGRNRLCTMKYFEGQQK